MCVTAYCVHSQDDEDFVINAFSDAVKRYPNLVEVTVDWGFSGPPALGLVKGVLQKKDVRKVDVIESQFPIDPLSKSVDVWISECECLCVCVVSAVCSRVHCVSTCIQLPRRTLSKSTSYLQ